MEMNHFRKKFYARLNVLLGSVLAMLGFSSCDDGPFNSVDLYGCPYANFDVKGTVLSEEGETLQGVTVTTKEVYQSEDGKEMAGESTKSGTDVKGMYRHRGSWGGHPSEVGHLLRVVVEDPRGVYASDSMDVQLTRTAKGKDDWCQGTDEGTADFRLKKNEEKE